METAGRATRPATGTTRSEGNPMQPVVRSLDILRTLAENGGGLTLQELADVMALPVSTTHRLTNVLKSQGYVTRTLRGKRMILGPAVGKLVASTSSEHLRTVADPVMTKLNRKTGETVFMAELVGHEITCVAFRPAIRPLKFFVELGRVMPLHAASSARSILAFLDAEEREQLLEDHEYTRWTERTIPDHDSLLTHLESVRKQGYDVCDDELEPDVWAVAAPLHDVNHEIRASLVLVTPLPAVRDETYRQELQHALLAAANEISGELSGPRTPDSTSRPLSV